MKLKTLTVSSDSILFNIESTQRNVPVRPTPALQTIAKSKWSFDPTCSIIIMYVIM